MFIPDLLRVRIFIYQISISCCVISLCVLYYHHVVIDIFHIKKKRKIKKKKDHEEYCENWSTLQGHVCINVADGMMLQHGKNMQQLEMDCKRKCEKKRDLKKEFVMNGMDTHIQRDTLRNELSTNSLSQDTARCMCNKKYLKAVCLNKYIYLSIAFYVIYYNSDLFIK